MSQKLPVNNFERIKDTSQFNKDFMKKNNEESDDGYFLEVDVQYPERLHELHILATFRTCYFSPFSSSMMMKN